VNTSRKNSSRKSSSQKSGILALIALVAIACIKLDRTGSADTQTTAGTHEVECSALSRCAANLKLAYPLGDGLVFTPIMDDSF
jgi:hypothetical protein